MKYGDAIYRNMKTKRVFDQPNDVKYLKWSKRMPGEGIVRNIFFVSLILLIVVTIMV